MCCSTPRWLLEYMAVVKNKLSSSLHLFLSACFLQFVPLVVELCIDIVETKGLENQGIYRVPGNTGAVNMLQELLNNSTVRHVSRFHGWITKLSKNSSMQFISVRLLRILDKWNAVNPAIDDAIWWDQFRIISPNQYMMHSTCVICSEVYHIATIAFSCWLVYRFHWL